MAYKRIKKVVVDRSKWANGSTTNWASTCLLDPDDGHMCCLGFACEAAGVSQEHLCWKSLPEDIGALIPVLTERDAATDSFVDTSFTGGAITINDDRSLTKRARERKLKAHFRESGIELKFVGRSPRKALDRRRAGQ